MNMNYDVSLFVVMRDKEIIHYTEYDENNNDDAVFIMVTNDHLNQDYRSDNTIFIYKNIINETKQAVKRMHLKNGEIDDNDRIISSVFETHMDVFRNTFLSNEKYHINSIEDIAGDKVFDSIEYIDGFLTCQDMILKSKRILQHFKFSKTNRLEEFIPAIMLAYHTNVDFNDKTNYGFLPSIGQLIYISKNIFRINRLLVRILGESNNLFPENASHNLLHRWWSSTEMGCTDVMSMESGFIIPEHKKETRYVLPLFQIEL